VNDEIKKLFFDGIKFNQKDHETIQMLSKVLGRWHGVISQVEQLHYMKTYSGKID
jgi:hypothetical protein